MLLCFDCRCSGNKTKKKKTTLTEPANVVQNERTAFYALDGIDRDRQSETLCCCERRKNFVDHKTIWTWRNRDEENVIERAPSKSYEIGCFIRSTVCSKLPHKNWSIRFSRQDYFDGSIKWTESQFVFSSSSSSISLTKKKEQFFFLFTRVSHLFLATPY